MASLILTLALASTVLAQDSSSQTPSSSETPSTTSLLLPFYPPYPISSIDPSSSSSSQGPSETATPLDYYWQHEYRDYYASIITVVSTSTLVYAIDCAPNSRHPSYSLPDFNSALVCASTVVGAGPITVTQGPEQWAFAATQAVREFNRSTTATEMNTWDVTCGALSEKTKTCTYVNEWEDGEASTLVVPSGRVGSAAIDGFQNYFTTMSEVLVTVTAGVEKIPASVLSSLEDDATGVVSLVTSLSPDQSSNAPAGVSSSTGAAPRVTGIVGKEALFGAAGVLGAAVFGL